MRRAKDLPVFVTWLKPEGPNPLSILAHQLRRRFRSNNSLLRGARLAYRTATRRIAFPSARPAWPKSKPSNFPRPFLGRPL